MFADGIESATAGHRVGYESASQFSREYRRLFGGPPRAEIARLREAGSTA
jgi:AraC-like DNA-binding protein